MNFPLRCIRLEQIRFIIATETPFTFYMMIRYLYDEEKPLVLLLITSLLTRNVRVGFWLGLFIEFYFCTAVI